MLFMFHVCVGSPRSICTAGLSWWGPRHRRLLRRCHTASTRRSLHCRSRRTIAPPRTYGAWNAAAVTLAGHGGGTPSTRSSRALRPLPTITRHDGFYPSLLSRPPSLSGTGVPPQDVSRRGLPRRGTPLVPLPCLIYCHGFHVLCPRVPAWFPKNPPWVGQSFPTERLGFSLTSRLATPLDWPSHHTRPGAPVFFFHPESAGGSRFRIRQHGAKRKKEHRQIRDRRVLIGRGLAR